MKIHPPKLNIEEQNPFKDALYDRKAFADSLTNLLRNIEDNLVVFVNADWGEGKTTSARMWRHDLLKQNVRVIYFDAFSADHFDDPFACFSAEILKLAKTELKVSPGNFKESATKVGKAAGKVAIKAGLRLITGGLIKETDFRAFEEPATEASDIVAKFFEKKLEDYDKEKDAIKAFKESLEKIANNAREKQNGFPLTIIVDELDRCRPDFALDLLERVKHLFDAKGVAFVFLVNLRQIEDYVKTIYGGLVDAPSYLLKFADLFVELPAHDIPHSAMESRRAYIRSLFRHYGLDQLEDQKDLQGDLMIFGDHFRLTLRETEKVFNVVVPFYASRPRFGVHALPALLAAIKIKRPKLYQRLVGGTVSAQDLVQEASLNLMAAKNRKGLNYEWLNNILDVCLLSQNEFDAATGTASLGDKRAATLLSLADWLTETMTLSRNDVVQTICQFLDSFSYKR